MHSIALFAVVSLISILGSSNADAKAPQSLGAPPFFATVGKVDSETKSLLLQFRTVHFVTEEVMTSVVDDGKATEVAQKVVHPVYETLTKSIPLESATFREAGGKAIKAEDVAKRLSSGTVVVVSADGQVIDPAYLKALAKDAIIVVDNSSVQPTAKSDLLFPPSIDFQAPKSRAVNR